MKHLVPALIYLNHLFGRGIVPGTITFRHIGQYGGRSESGHTLDSAEGVLEQMHVCNRAEADIFVGVNPRPTRSDLRKHIPLVHAIVTELDIGKDIPTPEAALELAESLPLRPTMVMDSGSGGLHLYWRLTEGQPSWKGQQIGKALKARLNITDDVWGCERVWRLPGFENWKRDKKTNERTRGRSRLIWCDDDRAVSLEELAGWLDLELPLKEPKQTKRKARTGTTENAGPVGPISAPPSWINNYRKLIDQHAIDCQEDKSTADMKFAVQLIQRKVLDVEALAGCIGYVRALNVGDTKAHRPDYLRRTAMKALEGTRSSAPSAETTIPPEQAREAIWTQLLEASESRSNTVMAFPTGSGKTHAVSRYVAEFAQGDTLTKRPVVFAAPTYKHTEEVAAKVAELSNGRAVVQTIKSLAEGCIHPGVEQFMRMHGHVPGMRRACQGCDLRAECPTHAAKDERAHLILMTHQTLMSLEADSPLVDGRLVIIDEVPPEHTELTFSRAELQTAQSVANKRGEQVLRDTFETVGSAANKAAQRELDKQLPYPAPLQGKRLRKALTMKDGPYLVEMLRTFSENEPKKVYVHGKGIREGREDAAALTPSHVQLLEKLCELVEGKEVPELIFQADAETGWSFTLVQPLGLRDRIQFVGLDAHYHDHPGRWERFAGSQHIECRDGKGIAASRSELIRVHVPYSVNRGDLCPRGRLSGDRAQRLAVKIARDVQAEMDVRGFGTPQRVGVIAAAPVTRVLNDRGVDGGYAELRDALEGLAPSVESVHWFGGTRGSNKLEGVDVLVVIGTPAANIGRHKAQYKAVHGTEDGWEEQYARDIEDEAKQAEGRARARNEVGQRTLVVWIDARIPPHWMSHEFAQAEQTPAHRPKLQTTETIEQAVQTFVDQFGVLPIRPSVEVFQLLMSDRVRSGTQLSIPVMTQSDEREQWRLVLEHKRHEAFVGRVRANLQAVMHVGPVPKASAMSIRRAFKKEADRLVALGEFQRRGVPGHGRLGGVPVRVGMSMEAAAGILDLFDALRRDELNRYRVSEDAYDALPWLTWGREFPSERTVGRSRYQTPYVRGPIGEQSPPQAVNASSVREPLRPALPPPLSVVEH